MDQDQIEIITVNDRNSAEIEKPAGAAVGEAFNAHEGSKEADSGSQPQNVNSTSDAQEVQSDDEPIIPEEARTWILAKAKGLEPTKINLWKVAFEYYNEVYTRSENQKYKREEEMRSLKNEIYQVIGFFSAFQGLLITAAAQSNLLRCNNVGFILALSAFAMAVAVFGIWQKIMAMEGLRCQRINIKYDMKCIHQCLEELNYRGIDFNFQWFRTMHSRKRRRASHTASALWKDIFDRSGTWLVLSVIAFGGLCLVAMRQIVCNPGHSLPRN
ncbi:unnamed protein product [Sphagnum troendelagicum]